MWEVEVVYEKLCNWNDQGLLGYWKKNNTKPNLKMMSIVRGLIPGGWDYFAQDHNPWESEGYEECV